MIDQEDSTKLEGIEVYVTKRKPAFIMGYKVVDKYYGRTDANGECMIMIYNYNREKYDFVVHVNDYEGTPPDFGGYTYSVWSTVLEEYELNTEIEARLTPIPFPNVAIGY